ncbi:MAG: response regulator [Candidatus Moranbacteria bacterium]|nr:response regulator [Candidatus Moranbacteria bacterium]
MKILLNLTLEEELKPLAKSLRDYGFMVDENSNFGKINWLVSDRRYEIIILEDNPACNILGIEILKNLKKKTADLPSIIISKSNSTKRRILAYKNEIDDFIEWPVSKSEFAQRLRNILAKRNPSAFKQIISCSKFKIDFDSFKVYKNDRELNLRRKEYDLFCFLIKHPKKVLNRTFILENVWDINADPFTNTVDVHIKNLRKKIGDKSGNIIRTVYGRGYEFTGK